MAKICTHTWYIICMVTVCRT